VPALAIADALRAEGARVVFAGGERAEAQLVPAAGYELEPLHVEGISRSNPLKAARAVFRAGAAIGAARRIVDGADAVLGGGGYVAGSVGFAALTRRIPVVLVSGRTPQLTNDESVADRVLPMPFDIDVLLTHVEQLALSGSGSAA